MSVVRCKISSQKFAVNTGKFKMSEMKSKKNRNNNKGVVVSAPLKSNLEEDTEAEDATDNIKHPLEHAWCLWLSTNVRIRNMAGNAWQNNLVNMVTFDTVEDFFCIYHHIKLPSEMSSGHDYAVFKKGIGPMWEDPANKHGGRWLVSLEKKPAALVDAVWLDVVLLMIGENFEHSEEVCGAVINTRKGKIGVWTKTASNKKANVEIGSKIKELLNLNMKLSYQIHDAVSNLYTV